VAVSGVGLYPACSPRPKAKADDVVRSSLPKPPHRSGRRRRIRPVAAGSAVCARSFQFDQLGDTQITGDSIGRSGEASCRRVHAPPPQRAAARSPAAGASTVRPLCFKERRYVGQAARSIGERPGDRHHGGLVGQPFFLATLAVRTASIQNLLSRCERFGLTAEAARKAIDDVVATVRTWRNHFRGCGVSAKDVEHIAPAFPPECFFLAKPMEG